MNMSESIIELSKALSKFQGEVKQPTKDGKNPHFKSNYVTIDGVVEAITETASKHGLSFMQFPVNEDDKVGVYTLVMHESGEWIKSEPIFTRLQKNDAQGVGSALTYLRRYSLSAVFGITSDVDDDGNQASYSKPQQQYQKPQQDTKQQYSNAISEAQVKMIKTLIDKVVKASGMESTMIVDVVKNKLSIGAEVRTNELTKGQASGFINELQEMEKVYEG